MVEPFGDTRADLRMGILATAIVGPWLKEGAKAPSPADFMPFLDHNQPKHERAPQSMKAQKNIFRHLEEAAKRKRK